VPAGHAGSAIVVVGFPAGSAIIDGEVVVPAAADGTTDFSVLQNELLRALKGADVSQEQKCR